MHNVVIPSLVANNILYRSFSQNVAITEMKLQRLLYFVYRNLLQTTGTSLFLERFEAWKYGPALPTIYAKFHTYGSNPIRTYSTDSKGDVFRLKEAPDSVLTLSINTIWCHFQNVSGIDMSKMTQKEGTAWYKAWKLHHQFLSYEDIRQDVIW